MSEYKNTLRLTDIELYADGRIHTIRGILNTANKSKMTDYYVDEFIKTFKDSKTHEIIDAEIKDNYLYTKECLYDLVVNTDELKDVLDNTKLSKIVCLPISCTPYAYARDTEENKEHLIKYIILEIVDKSKETLEKLVENGAEKVDETHIKLTNLTIRKWLALSNSFWSWCRNRYIMEHYNDIVIYLSDNFFTKDLDITIDDTMLNKLITWTNKARTLGIGDDYEIDVEKLTLKKYTGNSKKPMMPPVRVIEAKCFSQENKVDELNIPDTVERLNSEFEDFDRLNILKIGENLSLVDDDTFDLTSNLEVLNLNNILSEIYIRATKLKEIELLPNTKVTIEKQWSYTQRQYINNFITYKYKLKH